MGRCRRTQAIIIVLAYLYLGSCFCVNRSVAVPSLGPVRCHPLRRFSYTYLTLTPMHLSFSVIFGPDGHITEVTPVHGWD